MSAHHKAVWHEKYPRLFFFFFAFSLFSTGRAVKNAGRLQGRQARLGGGGIAHGQEKNRRYSPHPPTVLTICRQEEASVVRFQSPALVPLRAKRAHWLANKERSGRRVHAAHTHTYNRWSHAGPLGCKLRTGRRPAPLSVSPLLDKTASPMCTHSP